jgi:hypothetical protein
MEKKMKKFVTAEYRLPIIYFALAGFAFAFICGAEKRLAENGNIEWTAGFVGGLLALSVVGGILGIFLCLCLKKVFFYIRKYRDNGMSAKHISLEAMCRLTAGRAFAAALVLNVCAWFPAYLAYYPGICAYDTPIQLGQVFDGYMIDHHPIAHTLLFKAAIYVGQSLFDSINTGMGIYTFLQMTFLAFGFAYCVYTMRKLNVKIWWIIVAQICVMFYPFNIYMSVSTTKDTVFTGFFLILMSTFARLLIESRDSLHTGFFDFVLFVSTVGAILFRNNCIYAVIVLLPFLLITALASIKRKSGFKLFMRLFIIITAAVVAGNIALTALFELTDAGQGDRREMLSMPIQQFARCMLYHGGVGELAEDDGTMDDEAKNLINDFLLDESYREYVPAIADPVKRHTNTYVARYRSGDFIRTYIKLLKKYPGDFINAALALDAGYLYPEDVSHAHINEEEGLSGRGYIQTYWLESDLTPRGLTKASKWESLHDIMEKWADRNGYLDIPVLKYLLVPGSFFWAYVLIFGIILMNGKGRMLLPMTLVFGYYATLFLGPTVQLRYIFPLMAVLPFVVLFSSVKGKMIE